MIKGINKQIIEINDTGNRYYEKAILFLRPEYADVQKDILEKEAKKLLKIIDTTSSVKQRKKVLYWFVRLAPCVLLGAVVSIIFMNCFFG